MSTKLYYAWCDKYLPFIWYKTCYNFTAWAMRLNAFLPLQLFLSICDFIYLNDTPQFSLLCFLPLHVFSCHIWELFYTSDNYSLSSAWTMGEGLFKNRMHHTFLEYHAMLCSSAVSYWFKMIDGHFLLSAEYWTGIPI